ncbi:superinfection immunity protein [Pseudomonas proteolytica]|jgi:hypothetical protein|uniref:superinfection immunity protein n=1 Tax=Pseudomonas proteolytica TaxID=219574 RepID=UPI0030DC69F3
MKVFGLALLAPTCLVSYFISSGDNGVAIAADLMFYITAIALYLFPSIYIALVEPVPPRRIFIINLLAGWTLIGWCAAYYLALRGSELRVEDELSENV